MGALDVSELVSSPVATHLGMHTALEASDRDQAERCVQVHSWRD